MKWLRTIWPVSRKRYNALLLKSKSDAAESRENFRILEQNHEYVRRERIQDQKRIHELESKLDQLEKRAFESMIFKESKHACSQQLLQFEDEEDVKNRIVEKIGYGIAEHIIWTDFVNPKTGKREITRIVPLIDRMEIIYNILPTQPGEYLQYEKL